MDSYLIRRKKDNSTKKRPKIHRDEEFNEEDELYSENNKNIFERFLDFLSPRSKQTNEQSEYEEMENVQEDQEYEDVDDDEFKDEVKERKSILEKIKSWLYLDSDTNEEYVDEYETQEEILVEDAIIEALKIQNKWLKQLPQKKIKEFKASPDYIRYKEILEEFNLIRKD
jgi:hypothetical protein